jgi:hypothetical protein
MCVFASICGLVKILIISIIEEYMKEYPNIINDPIQHRLDRLAALRFFEDATGRFGTHSIKRDAAEVNNHIHTIYSFSPFSPSMAALLAREAGLGTAGSVDHDSIAAAEEMLAACAILGIGGCVGFEVRVSLKTLPDGERSPFAAKKINNPDSEGLIYMTVQGIPKQSFNKAAEFLTPLREQRLERIRAMTVSANDLLSEAGVSGIDFELDILACSKYAEGGGITERHLLAAAAKKMIQKYKQGQELPEGLKKNFGLTVPPRLQTLLSDPGNPHYLYDLLGVLKTEFLPGIFIQPDDRECIPVHKVTEFANSIAAIPVYPYLGDVGESPTGDKKTEKFEDDYIEELFAEISRLGFRAITYMPPRNTAVQLRNLRKLSAEWGFMEITGVDINSSRQSFNCPEVLQNEFRHLLDTTWALITHERLASIDERYGLFSENNPLNNMELPARLLFYANLGKKLDLYHPDESAAMLAKEIDII